MRKSSIKKYFPKLFHFHPPQKKVSGGAAFFQRPRAVSLLLARQHPVIFLKFLFFSLIFASSTVAAQFQFEIWTTKQGLPYKVVNSVLQTRDGYVWAATGDGLARFDGVRFTVFTTANTKNLPTNRLGHLVETDDGSLWMSGEGRGLIRLKAGKFTNYTTADGLPSDHVLHLVFVRSKNLLRVITNKGAARRLVAGRNL